MSFRNIHPAGDLPGRTTVVRLYDQVLRVKVDRSQLLNLFHQCDSLLYTVREYTPRLVETARAEANGIERAVEHILKKLLGWTKLSDKTAYLKQGDIQYDLEQCHQELPAYAERFMFMMALSMTNNSESQMQELAGQRDPWELMDVIARLSKKVRKPGDFVTTEPLRQGDSLQHMQVIDLEGRRSSPVVPPSRTRSRLSDLSGKVSRAEDLVAIEGSLLVFYLGEWTNRDQTALARLRDQSSASEMRFKKWIEASVGLQHRNVLSSFGHVTIEGVVHAVNPWMENGTIREYIRANPHADRMRLLSQVASGMEFLHENKVTHGDLCGKNILVNGEGKAFVCGFGLSEFSNPTLDVSRARWFAPERITTMGITPPTEEVDVWSFGLLCLEVFTGEDPYRSYSDFYVPVLLKEGTTPEHPGFTAVGLTSRMWELMQSCWQINPAERPLMPEIQSTVCSMLPRRPRQPSSRNKDLSDSIFPIIGTSNSVTYQGSSSSALEGMLHNSSPSVTPPLPSGTFNHKADTRALTGNRKTSDASSLAHKRLPPAAEVSSHIRRRVQIQREHLNVIEDSFEGSSFSGGHLDTTGDRNGEEDVVARAASGRDVPVPGPKAPDECSTVLPSSTPQGPVSPGPELRDARLPWFTETTSQAATSTALEGSEDSNTYSRIPGLKLRGKQSNYQRNRQDEPSARQTDYNLSDSDDDVDADNDEENNNFDFPEEFSNADTGSYNGPYSIKTASHAGSMLLVFARLDTLD